MLAVDVELGERFSAGQSRVLFEERYEPAPWTNQNYDVTPDGDRFVMIRRVDDPPIEIRVVLNAISGIRRTRAVR